MRVSWSSGRHPANAAQPATSAPMRETLRASARCWRYWPGERDVDIARALTICVRTVRSHLNRIREKTGQRRRSELTRLAIGEGLLRRRARA